MTGDSSRSDPFSPDLFVYFQLLVNRAHELGRITGRMRDSFQSMVPEDEDELLECANNLIEVLSKEEYYKTLERIEKADEVIEVEADEEKKKLYITARTRLINRLEEIA